MSTVEEKAVEKLEIRTKIDKVGACERHVVVTIPRPEIERYFRQAFSDLGPKAEMPGFRVGKAPRKLVESRFRAQIADQVKSSLVLDALQQVTEGGEFSAISEPEFDYGAVQLPDDDGDFTFEFKIEVRPEFETPNWKGLSLVRPTHAITDKDIEEQLSKTLSRITEGEPVDGQAEPGDTLLIDIEFSVDGQPLDKLEEARVVLRKRLSFSDAVIENFDEVMKGVSEGQDRKTTVKISDDSDNEPLRGKEVELTIHVIEIRRITIEDLRPNVLDSLGFKDAAELRDYVRAELEKQLQYFQHQRLRKQITHELTQGANWEMPKEMVRRQTNRELQRLALELKSNNFSEEDIQSYLNSARRNATESTVAALREHFVLEKIAEEMNIEPSSEEYDKESKSSPRIPILRLAKCVQSSKRAARWMPCEIKSSNAE